jgi:4-diphosphocytidyl-2-C-methyl-D-erythritol kinase
MLAFPYAKINLGLRVLRKRSDGYHDIDSCLYPIPWRDVLEIVPARSFRFQQTGLSIPGNESDNLCVKAYELIREKKQIGPVQIHLHKVIPMGAGLGGGSSDGATTLKLLNALFQLELSEQELMDLASVLGSDCPFFIKNSPAIASGTGTTLTPIDLTLAGAWIALFKPDIHISTKEAYDHIQPDDQVSPVKELLSTPIEKWKSHLVNDFASGLSKSHPEIGNTVAHLYEKGALYAAMSGSGSAVFGIFSEEPELPDFEVFELR